MKKSCRTCSHAHWGYKKNGHIDANRLSLCDIEVPLPTPYAEDKRIYRNSTCLSATSGTDCFYWKAKGEG